MYFQEKLRFLMKITQTTNKDLARSISVDPSLISLLRTGKRKTPHNQDHIKHMAEYFARHCTADYQRQAVAEMLERPILRSVLPTEELAGYLYHWLSGDTHVLTPLIESWENLPQIMEINIPSAKNDTQISDTQTSTYYYYGQEGKLNALRRVISLLSSDHAPDTFLISSAETLEWLLRDLEAANEYRGRILERLRNGFSICQILPSVNQLNHCVDLIRFWLPLYSTGQVTAYYYPRLRDNLYQRDMFILPGKFAMVSTALSADQTSFITLVTTDPKLVNAHVNEFHLLRSMCDPALKVHTNVETIMPCFSRVLSSNSTFLQKVYPISAPTLPVSLLEECISASPLPQYQASYRFYLESVSAFHERLKSHRFIDLSRLSTPEEICAGEVAIASPFKVNPAQPCYTPETYALHLKNILQMMDEYDNYYFVPLREDQKDNYNLVTAENCMALLIKTSPPVLMMEVNAPDLIRACQEYLFYEAEQIGYEGIYREKIKSRLRALIAELENIKYNPNRKTIDIQKNSQ